MFSSYHIYWARYKMDTVVQRSNKYILPKKWKTVFDFSKKDGLFHIFFFFFQNQILPQVFTTYLVSSWFRRLGRFAHGIHFKIFNSSFASVVLFQKMSFGISLRIFSSSNQSLVFTNIFSQFSLLHKIFKSSSFFSLWWQSDEDLLYFAFQNWLVTTFWWDQDVA